MLHSSYRYTNGVHYPISYEYSSSTTRLAATGFVATDLYKFAVQLDNASLWMLTATTPTWVQIGTGGAIVSNVSSLANGKIWIGDGSGIAQEKTMSGNGTISNAGALSVSDLTITSQAAGDVLYCNGTNWVRLAKDAGKYLKSGASAVSWDTPAGGSSTHALMVSIMGAVYVADGIVWIRLPYAMTLSKVRLGLQTKGTGTGSTKAKIVYHASDPSSATTIFSTGPETQAPACTSSDFTDDSGTPDVTSLSAGGWLGIGFSAVCATTPGSNAVIELLEA